MTPAMLLLVYLCTPPAADGAAMACVARELRGATCEEALALAGAAMRPDRLWHAVACIDVGLRAAPPAVARRPGRATSQRDAQP